MSPPLISDADDGDSPIIAGGLTAGALLGKIGTGWFHVLAVCALGLANAADAVEVLCIGFILPQEEVMSWVSGVGSGALSATVFGGMLLGGLLGGAASDAWGRRPALAAALALNIAAGLAAAAANGWPALAAARTLAGVGVGASVPPIFAMATELLPAGRRGAWLSVIAWAWTGGTLLTAALAWLTIGEPAGAAASWRLFTAVAVLPAAAGLVLLFAIVPESPRWLASRGRAADARAALRYIARLNGRTAAVPELMEGAAAGGAASPPASPLPPPPPPPPPPRRRLAGGVCAACARVETLFAPALRRSTLCLLVVWFVLSLAWYGLGVWLPTLFKSQGAQMLGLYADALLAAAASVPGNLLATLIIDRVSRRYLLVATLAASAACGVGLALARGEAALLSAASVNNAISAVAWNAVNVLSAEAFPTAARSSAMGMLSATGRLGSIIGQIMFGALVAASPVVLLGTVAALLLAGAAAAALLPAGKAEPCTAGRAAAAAAVSAAAATGAGGKGGIPRSGSAVELAPQGEAAPLIASPGR